MLGFFKNTNSNKALKKLQEAEDYLKQDKLEDAKLNLSWIEIASNIKAIKNKKKNLLLGLIVGVICFGIIGLILIIRIPAATVSLNIQTKSISFKSVNPITYNTSTSVKFLNVSKVDSLLLDLTMYKSKKSSPMNIKGDAVKIEKLYFPQKSNIQFQKYVNQIFIFIEGYPFRGDLKLRHGQLDYENYSFSIDIDKFFPSRSLIFYCAKPHKYDNKMFSMISEDFVFDIDDFDSINFTDETKINSGKYKSVISGGLIDLIDIQNSETLKNGDSLTIAFTSNEGLIIEQIENGLSVHIKGSVNKLGFSRQGKYYDIMPSIFEYLYMNERVAVIWGGLIFVWGLLWSFKNTLIN